MLRTMKALLLPTCRDVTELATDYMERKLSLRAHFGVRLHLAGCAGCRRYVHQLNKTVAFLRDRPLGPAASGIAERIADLAASRGDKPTDDRST